jgi:CRP/FNR family transcriptional regulator, cyclic AMP receptor protein
MRIQSEAAILSVLKTVPLFQQLDSSALEALAAVASMSELSDGDVLFEEGAAADEVIFVMTGSIRLTCEPGGGPEIVVGYVQAGDILGEMAVIDPAPRSASARGAEGAVVLHLPKERFDAFLESGHPVARVMLVAIRQMMTQRIRVLNERISALFLIDAEEDVGEEFQSMVVRLRGIWSAVRSGG